MNVKLKISSSSLFSLRRKLGADEGSGSCTNSTRPVSLDGRVTAARVAGKALGVIMVEVRFRGHVITREDIDTSSS